MSKAAKEIAARLAAKRAAAATRVPPTTTDGNQGTPESTDSGTVRKDIVWIKYPPSGVTVGSSWELIPVANKAEARIEHAEGYSVVDLVRPVLTNATMTVMRICKVCERSIQVQVTIA